MNTISKKGPAKTVPATSHASLISLIEEIEKSESLSKKLCTYDGIKLRIRDKQYISSMLSDEMFDKFNFKSQVNRKGQFVISSCGKYRNFSIKIHYAPQGQVVDISGSIHKWFNNGEHNYNRFYYLDFLKSVKEVIEVFDLDAVEVQVVNLEVGVNCTLPPCIPLTVKEVIKHITYIFTGGRIIKKTEEKYRESLLVHKGEKYYKVYDKGLQNKRADERIIRMEIGYTTSRQLETDAGIISVNDLFSIDTMDKLNAVLKKSFSTLHTFQPELYNRPGIQHFSSPSYWKDLKKKGRSLYQKQRSHQEKLTAVYTTYNLRVVLLAALKYMLP